jgi:hypothetical protein
VIQQDHIVLRLLQACPSARSAWDEHLAWWGDQERGIYNDTAVFAHHMNTALKAGDTREFAAFFGALEDFLADGNSDAKTVAVIGIIETLQNVASHEPPGYQPFERWLGPLSRQSWAEVEQMWSGKESLMDRGLLTPHSSGRASRAAHCER